MAISPELTYDTKYRKYRKLFQLSLKEKLDIAHKSLILHYPLADVALLYRVKLTTVRVLVNKIEKDGSLLAELQEAEEHKAEQEAAIIKEATKMDKTEDGILRAEDVVQEVKETH